MAEQDRDLVLSPTQYAFVQDRTNGNVKVWNGPRADTLTANDRLVVWTGRKYIEQPDVNQARTSFTTATENQYVVLTNPKRGDYTTFPDEASATLAPALDIGKQIVIPGPVSFALWPGQEADVVGGHRLSYNEYLVVQVYDPGAAEREQGVEEPAPDTEAKKPARAPKENYKIGERRVIKGTEKSFYIPPTGIEVLRETLPDGKPGEYVRKAAVVEQLEYVCLVDENGRKRYERGPQVVFPEPTETFVTERNERKFRAIELNAQSGIYVKVTAEYNHEGDSPIGAWRGDGIVEVKPGESLHEGDELFLTGSDTPIYFPRTEHSLILYGDKRKHHAIAIPAGEGRYVLDRTSGEVRKETGPSMFLPDPRTEVIVRRVLDPKTTTLWYPGNHEAMNVNIALAGERSSNEAEYLVAEPQLLAATAAVSQPGSLSRSYNVSAGLAADKMKRGTEYTPTRTVTLDTKYLGPPGISVLPGYAVMVMDPTGNRHVEEGPVDLLMAYHETLMALTLSTGRPKGTGAPLRTVYLRTINNAVGDRVTVETRDLVPVTVELSLRVNFEGESLVEQERWFHVEDYVALLTDNVRSRIRNLGKRHDVQEFYANTIDLIRDDLLGVSGGEKGRTGRVFPENGMRLYDVEILGVTIQHPAVKSMLDQATASSLEGAIRVSQEEESTRREATLQALKRARLEATEETRETESAAAIHEIERQNMRALRAIAASLQEAEEEAKITASAREQEKFAEDQDVAFVAARDNVALARQAREVALFVERAKAVSPELIEAIRTYGQEMVVREITTALAPMAFAGVPAVDIMRQQFGDTVFGGVLDALARRPLVEANGVNNG